MIRIESANTIRARGDNTPHKIGRIYGSSLKLWTCQLNSAFALASEASPYMFIERLKRKAENACGSVVEFSTFKTRLSQTCICGKREKKPLSQRIHRCVCGVEAQRDLFSAYLARFVQEDRLDVSAAKESWTGVEMLLRTAFEWKCQTTSRGTCPSSFGTSKEILEKSGSSAEEGTECKLRKPDDESWNAVKPGLTAWNESPRESNGISL